MSSGKWLREKTATERKREIYAEAKQKPCMDCGIQYPAHVMQFDHVRGEKRYPVSAYSYGNYSLKEMLKEIEKCELVCANCHAERTHQRRQGEG